MATMNECAMNRKQEIANMIGEETLAIGTLGSVIDYNGNQANGEPVNAQALAQILIDQAGVEVEKHIQNIFAELAKEIAELEKKADFKTREISKTFKAVRRELRLEAKKENCNFNMLFLGFKSMAHNLSNAAHIRARAYTVAIKNTQIWNLNNWYK